MFRLNTIVCGSPVGITRFFEASKTRYNIPFLKIKIEHHISIDFHISAYNIWYALNDYRCILGILGTDVSNYSKVYHELSRTI